MKALLSAMRTVPGMAGLCAALLLGAVAWFFAPALFGIGAWWALLLLAALPVLIWAAAIVWAARRAQKRDAALVAGATQVDERVAKSQAAVQATKEEEAAVAAKLAGALLSLKAAGTQASGKGGYLYERPWYVLIGPPGAGKTIAVRNSGLGFPLADAKLKGVGGTRDCDWWISDQAVLIDTAGRYTTQDSDAQVDKAGWDRFLDLLKRERSAQPLNGIVVVFGADMLCKLDAAGREQNARAVRQRVQELEQRLGQRLPIYLLVSKADLVAGFTEFFDDLDAESRRQVWGVTFAPEYTNEGSAEGFRPQFNALVRRLHDRLLERLQAERGLEQRAAIAGFPGQFASLEEPITAFVQAAFGGSKLDPAPYLRGVYFTSGTQEGTPIDRLTGALSRAFGLEARYPATKHAHKGRSYFLGRLLMDVVFDEARLAVRDRGSEKRRRLVWLGTAAASVGVLLGCMAWGWHAVSREGDRAVRLSGATSAAEQSAQQLAAAKPLEQVRANDDPGGVLAYLERTRLLAEAARGSGGAFGISQEAKLTSAADVAYQHALERVWLPRLLARLEGQIRAQMQQPAYLYLATRIYLMLGRQGPMDATLIQEWMAADWEQAYPGNVNAAAREQMAAHLQSLLKSDFARYDVDGALVDSARRVFSRLPIDERIYARLRRSATGAPAWKPADALGPSGQKLFMLQGGGSLAQVQVPGIFTVEGLHRHFLPSLSKAIKEAAAESWVLGPEGAALVSDPVQLETAVMQRYARDYVVEWQKLLDSLSLVPLTTPAQAADALNLLGAPKSPLRDLLRAIARQLTPGTPPPPRDAATAAGSALGAAASAVAAALPASGAAAGSSRVAEAIGLRPPTNPAAVVAEVVEARFRDLREASGPALDPVLGALNELYSQVSKIANSAPGSALPAASSGADPGQALSREAQRAPEPLARWLKSLNQTSSNVRLGGAVSSLAAAAAQQLKPFCQNLEARFPFNRSSTAPDMPIGDFGRLFGPGGALDQYFNQNLREVVDTSQRTWRPASVGGAPAPVSAGDVLQFQRAAAIRNAFFPVAQPGAGAGGTLRFELVPMGGTGAVLTVDSGPPVVLPASGQPGRPVALQWPAPGRISLAFDGEPPAAALANDGPWAALRFVMRGRLQPTNIPDRLRITIQSGAKVAEFELRTNSIVHPFLLPELADFRCPRLGP